jgi:carboxypeptidase Q
VASESIYSPHTGSHVFDYPDPICTAAITVEDSEMFDIMADRGWKIVLNLTMESKVISGVNSHNFIAEIKGYDDTKNH